MAIIQVAFALYWEASVLRVCNGESNNQAYQYEQRSHFDFLG
ncbi:hypothetical protein ABIF38_002869 [Bradyrhizobium japonicum]|uniref:Uncharacterized protein n=1 Tax=Bradyrhizobium elkanii TaxID=29448 RepID=A0ABV4FD03_BRAEL|nr:hypothetical protein [Bradyrhizobium elkanii]MCP1734819.1 hypothetical protein [Bradyrhizobium elkanii]MCP1752926.1 hypothetical protein [Bradyrhizobium elkanii]MCP1975326.1 hypothetical protein [Bradyrhizobium elkanii]MCS3570158.1 hypothetical protein [Bradyrhizobium elkanii]